MYRKLFFASFSLFLIFPLFVLAGNISSTNKYARFLDGSDRINFNPSTGNVTVSATSMTGYAWGENESWINLAPTLGGVDNDGEGNLSGYAWGEDTGWVNFNPTNGGVTIDCSGNFNGYAWSERRGWVVFNCATDSSCGTLDHKVQTTWTAASCPTSTFQCNDGADNDNDGKVDFPTDTGCASETDDNESNGGGGPTPGGPGVQPQCSDNKDNDLDGLVDRFDHACHIDNDPTNPDSYSPNLNNENARPIISLLGPGVISLDIGDTFTDPGAVALDAEDGDISGSIITTGSVNTNSAGDYVLVYTVFDSDGLPALPVTRIVKIISNVVPPIPNTPPVINIIGFPVIVIHEGDPVPEPGFTALDKEDGNITSIVVVASSVNPDVIGSYVIVYRVTDSGGLTDTVTRIVDVVPKDVPIPPPPPPPPPNLPPPEERPGGEGPILFPPGPVPDILVPVVLLVDKPAFKFLALLGLISAIFAVLGSFGLSPARAWGWLLSFFGLRKRYRPWGTVYDSVTKQPLDPAYVTLTDEKGVEIATSITDIDGRYGFLAASGVYTIKAQKTNYIFPSIKLSGKTNDELYPNLYFGEKIELKEEEGIVARNIPMDPINFDWNEFAKKDHKVMRMYSRFDPLLVRLSDFFFHFGLIISIVAFYTLPAPYNTIIFILYIIMLVLRILGLKPRFNGRLIDAETKKPLSFAIIRVKSAEIMYAGQPTEIAKRVADSLGRYYLLVPIGTYTVTVEKKNNDGTYSHVFTSPVFTARKGIINKTFKI